MSRRGAGLAELVAAWVVAGWVVWLWPRLEPSMVGAQHWWVGLGIVVVMGGAGLAEALGLVPQDEDDQQVHLLTPQVCKWGGWGLVGLGLAGIGLGRWVGNYQLWVAVGYLLGVNLRVAGIVVAIRPDIFAVAGPAPRLVAAASAGAAGLQLATALWLAGVGGAGWPPEWSLLGGLLLRAGGWGLICGVLASMAQRPGPGRRGWWMVYTAMAFGPGPVFSALSIPLKWLLAMAAAAVGLGALGWLRPGKPSQSKEMDAGGYWLMRGMMLLWWGVGIGLAIVGGWWQQQLLKLVLEAKWIRAVVVGGVLVSCVGLLVEYSLPLLGRSLEGSLEAAQRKVLGMVLSAGAVVAALVPLVMVDLGPPPVHRPAAAPRAVVLNEPVVLRDNRTEIKLGVPSWLRGLSRIYVVSHLEGADVTLHSEPVARVVATDLEGRVYVFALRAGIDTAQRDLARMGPAPSPLYESPRIYASWMAYTPAGQPFYAHDYITGLYLGHRVEALKKIIIARVNAQKELKIVLKKVMIY